NETHSIDDCRILCAGHNAHSAELLYGKDFMKQRRAQAARRGETDAGTPQGGVE
ncbi:MAG: hypothetical protein HYY06_32315, partial [Deltaproteobacteria bacterium]|nr:hypothetical protein [Deltaproteobacteria bacterium]